MGEALPPPPPPAPQFEPVSPDDSEPAQLHSEGPTQRGLGSVGVMPGHIPLGVLPGVATTPIPHPAPPTFMPPGSHTPTPYGMETMWTTPQLEPSQDPRRHVMGGASHGGLLPHPPPHLPPPHPGAPPHMIMSQPPHNYGPARRPPLFHPRPPGGSGGMY
ncbi:hypothetical protein GBAR_LOCUS5648 [Geodia barretti]|uniref:Uncharacterized protein n=1 Tax=Geodia barretti TaxID=519541 RepID=A0AA35W4V6_GEOBA|nr:hypothetical protein GBAR_LOCUS5648 [Geodia barretti]